MSSSSSGSTDGSSGSSSVPIIAGRYALHGALASGGMAQLHLGVMHGAVGFARIVAIKRLLGHLAADKDFVGMFVDEARLASRIRHPNVIPTLDVVSERNELFVVMEYVHGEALAKLISTAARQRKEIALGIVLDVGIGMLAGLHAAHEAKSERGEPLQIVHRDVSPQNILVGVDGVTRVFDFGIAKAQSRVYESNHGSLKGKFAYMAPEQIMAENIDRRADIWAASVVLWEMIARRRLFVADNAPAYKDLILAHPIDRPSTRAGSDSGVYCPPELDAILMRGLERDPQKRWQTASDMSRAIEEIGRRATAREIGAWVEESARETLAKRLAVIEAVETKPEGEDTAPGPSLRKQVAALAQANVAADVTTVLPDQTPPPSRAVPADTFVGASSTVMMPLAADGGVGPGARTGASGSPSGFPSAPPPPMMAAHASAPPPPHPAAAGRHVVPAILGATAILIIVGVGLFAARPYVFGGPKTNAATPEPSAVASTMPSTNPNPSPSPDPTPHATPSSSSAAAHSSLSVKSASPPPKPHGVKPAPTDKLELDHRK